jgi:alpha-L-fucosidase
MSERESKPFTAGDIRFTTKGDALYAICLGWPGDQAIIKSLGSNSAVRAEGISRISMLGVEGSLFWSQDEEGLKIRTPSVKPCLHAYTFKIVLNGN